MHNSKVKKALKTGKVFIGLQPIFLAKSDLNWQRATGGFLLSTLTVCIIHVNIQHLN